MERPPLISHPSFCFSLLSHRLTALNKKDTSTCLLWMSLWPHISARPQLPNGRRRRAICPSCAATSALAGHAYSAAGQAASALHLMAVLQVFQAKMLANEEAGLDSASLRDLRSATYLALSANQRHHPSHRAFDVQPYSVGAPPLAHNAGDERRGQISLPRRSNLVRQPVWTSYGGLC